MELESLRRLVREGESDTLELKKSLSDIDRIVEEVCGFANTHGGIVLIGVSDDGKIAGVEVARHTEERLANKIADNTEEPLSPSLNLIRLENGKTVMKIAISESKRKPHTAFGRPFKRIGTVTKRMPKEEYDLSVLERNAEQLRWDTTACKDSSFKDIDPQAVKPYLSMRARARNVSGKILMGAEQLLRNIGTLTIDGEMTRAGMAFFGREPERHLLNVRLRLVRIKGADRTGLILDKLDCEGVLWRMVDRAEAFIRRNIKLIGYLPQDSWRRKDTFDYPVGALREGIINAVIHRDYWQDGEVI